MFDNRKDKKNPKAPDFRCRDRECKDEKGYTPGIWVKDLKKDTARAQAHAPRPVPAAAGDFETMPGALEEEDDGLPF